MIFKVDKWRIIQEGFDNNTNEIAESVTSLANGHLGFRGNFEEDFSGSTLKGTYAAGVYYPDKTRVGWWKNGYPEYFAKVLNSCDFLSLHIYINKILVDINKLNVKNFVRTLDMKSGDLVREFDVFTDETTAIHIRTQRFVSIADSEIGAVKYSVTPITKDVSINLSSYISGDVKNADANYDEVFWNTENIFADDGICNVTLRTKKTDFWVSSSIKSLVFINEREITGLAFAGDISASSEFSDNLQKGETLTLYKYFAVTTSRDYPVEAVKEKSIEAVERAASTGFDKLYQSHANTWADIWKHSDIVIDGDDSAQQAIRFNIFQLNQTYTGKDSRLNIGPKGFTGEKYGGSTYWDTEAYCLPFYLSTAEESVSKNLLVYRYNHLEKAKENAAKLGLQGALYPMVTMNGEECHNEWEITFEEIHRNGAIAYAIYNYINYTGDQSYLPEYGIYVLYELSRFWASRVNYNKIKQKYMILGVTGPNEYENNVNNNYYTNKMCAFTLQYTLNAVNVIKENYPEKYKAVETKLSITKEELSQFRQIAENMHFPYSKEYDVFLQQDNFLDKEIQTVDNLLPGDKPLNQNWSWDRILRSCFIKQADVLQSIYSFPDEYTMEEKKRHFDFYEPMTVHESSLSPCIHSIIASQLGYIDKAYDLYLRTSRLDLDNYNNDTQDGLHITSMAGTWMSVVHGFGGLKVKKGCLYINPVIPEKWSSYSFNVYFRGATLNIFVRKSETTIKIISGSLPYIFIYNEKYMFNSDSTITVLKKERI